MPLTPEQLHAATSIDRSLCLVAGAGTGKTRVLVDRIVNQIDSGIPLDQVAAITFTRKAAAEMLTRLRREFRRRADAAKTPRDRATWLCRLNDLPAAYIGTIHGFCSRLLHSWPVEAGIDPHFDVMPDAELPRVADDAVRTTVERLFRERDPHVVAVTRAYTLSALLALLRSALAARHGIARAATTLALPLDNVLASIAATVEAVRIAELDALASSQSFVLAADFISAVAGSDGDVLEDFRRAAAEAAATIRSDGSVAERWGALEALTAIQLRGGAASKWPNAKTLKRAKEDLKALREQAQRILKDCTFADPSRWPEQVELARHLTRVALAAITEFQSRKLQRGLVDQDDLLILARDLLRDHAAVRQAAARRYRYLLVDELQDTDDLQVQILRLLLCDEPEPSADDAFVPRAGSFFGVGDPKQSIYRFRGADVDVFRAMASAFPEHNRGDLTLTFRFHEGLARLTNRIFEPLLGKDFASMSADDPSTPLPSAEILLAEVPVEGRVLVEELRRSEAVRITRRIIELRDRDGVSPGQMAILIPAYTHLHLYEDALRRADVPYYVASGRRFFEQREIRDVIGALRAIANPANDLAVAALLRSPFFAISDDGLLTLCRAGGRLLDALDNPDIRSALAEDDVRKAQRARLWLATYVDRAGRIGVAKLADEVVFGTGMAHVHLPLFLGSRRYANLRRLLHRARTHDLSGTSQVEEFLDELEASLAEGVKEAEAPLSEEGGDAVLLMTVHAAKGLEFPYVFLAATDSARRGRPDVGALFADGILGVGPRKPDRRLDAEESVVTALFKRSEQQQEQAEFLRLFYVAATRAQQRLVICGSTRIDTGSWLNAVDAALGLDLAAAGTGRSMREVAPGAHLTIDIAPATETGRRSAGAVSRFAGMVDNGIPRTGVMDSLAMVAPKPSVVAEWQARLAPVEADLSMLHLPATALVDYAACPARFHYRHVLGLPDPPSPNADREPAGVPASVIGTVLHECLRAIDPHTLALPDGFLADRIARSSEIPATARKEAQRRVSEFIRALAGMPWTKALREARDVRREVPFLLDIKGVTLTGQIDLLFQDKTGDWTLVDYKTDRTEPDGVDRHASRYRPQLLVYIDAAERLLGVTLKKSCLAFLSCGILSCISAEGGRDVLASLVEGIRRQSFERAAECEQGCRFRVLCHR